MRRNDHSIFIKMLSTHFASESCLSLICLVVCETRKHKEIVKWIRFISFKIEVNPAIDNAIKSFRIRIDFNGYRSKLTLTREPKLVWPFPPLAAIKYEQNLLRQRPFYHSDHELMYPDSFLLLSIYRCDAIAFGLR